MPLNIAKCPLKGKNHPSVCHHCNIGIPSVSFCFTSIIYWRFSQFYFSFVSSWFHTHCCSVSLFKKLKLYLYFFHECSIFSFKSIIYSYLLFLILYIKIYLKFWHMVDLQCVNFFWTVKGLSYTYISYSFLLWFVTEYWIKTLLYIHPILNNLSCLLFWLLLWLVWFL